MPLLGNANLGQGQGPKTKNFDKLLQVYLKNSDSITFYHFTEDFFNQILAMI